MHSSHKCVLYSCHPRAASHCPTVRDWTPDTGLCIVRGARDNGDALRAAITLVSKVKTLNATIHVVQACGTWVAPACASPLAPFVVSAALPRLLDRTHRPDLNATRHRAGAGVERSAVAALSKHTEAAF